MKIKLGKNLKRFAAGGIIITIAAGSCIGYQITGASQGGKDIEYRETALEYGTLSLTFEEEGTTQITTTDQLPEFSAGVVTMTVEEVYAGSGDTVSAGDALFKVTEESMEQAAAYYEKAVSDAKDALDTAEINYQTGILEAEYDLQETKMDARNASEAYEASSSSLDVKIEEKKQAYEEAVTQIQNYQQYLDNGTYYTKAGISEKQEEVDRTGSAQEEANGYLTEAQGIYENAKNTVQSGMENLNTQILDQVSYEELQVLAAQLSLDYAAMQTAAENLTAMQAAASNAASSLNMAQQKLETAAKDYNTNVEEAEKKITELTDSLEKLNEEYEQAKRDAVTQETSIQNDYDQAVLEGNYADTVYESAVSALEQAVSSAKETVEELEEEQAALLAASDGIICAAWSGILASVSYETEDVLMSDTAFASYYNTEMILISVEVPQDKISQIVVGDEVTVVVSGAGTHTGSITSIATTATTGGSMSNVTYAVVIFIENAEGRLSSGSSAEVSFCYGERKDVYYIESDAVNVITETTGTVQQYDETGNIIEVPVTIESATESYTVITEGIAEGAICLVEAGGAKE